jgi:hypothetical protein
MRPPPGSLREKTTPNFFISSTREAPVAAALGEPREGEHLAHAEAVAIVEDPFGDLVLTFGTDPLVVPSEDQEVVLRGRRGLPVGQIVRNESDDPFLGDVHLRREELRVDRREGLGGKLVAQVVGSELSDVADARQSFDQDRVAKLDLLQRADNDVLHGGLPGTSRMGAIKTR